MARPPRLRRLMVAFSSGSGVSKEQRQLLPQLLQLLRSGALASLWEGVSPVKIPPCGLSSNGSAPKKLVSANAGSVSKHKDRINTEPGWSPVKRAITSVTQVKDKLVNEVGLCQSLLRSRI